MILEKLTLKNFKTLQRMYGLINVFATHQFQGFHHWCMYSPCYCLQKAENCVATFEFHLCIQ